MTKIFCVLLITGWGCGSALHAGEKDQLPPGCKLVHLHNGVNSTDLDGDGKKDLITVGHRENYNAHSFDVTTIFIWTAGLDAKKPELQIVPWQNDAKEQGADPFPLHLHTGGGADGLLNDYRLFVDAKGKTAVLIMAEREFGESFADSQPVTFKYYKLARNKEEEPGGPTVYFAPYKEVKSKASYQHVGKAFQVELGVPSDGRNTWEE